MKKFLVKVMVFLALGCVLDSVAGLFFQQCRNHATGGEVGQLNYVVDQTEDEVLVFGSSRALRHYDPTILTDSLGLKCFNCGENGNGIIHSYGKYRLIRDRYTPHVLVYDLLPGYDLCVNDNERYLAWLRCFYDRAGIDSIVWDVDASEKWKMCSKMRRYNEKFVKLVADTFHPVVEYENGYRPLDGSMIYEPQKENLYAPSDLRVDKLKVKYWRKLVADCKARGTRLVFVVSPFYARIGGFPEFEPLRELARQEGIPLLWHADDSTFVGKKQYFHDCAHLNKAGAEAFSRIVASELRELLSEGK